MDNTKENHFQELMDSIELKLKQPLPGILAQQSMKATSKYKSLTEPNEFTKKSAVLILFYHSDGKIKIPFILRPKYDGMHGGQVAFPGGRFENFDENLIRTALREAQEEIGIKAIDVTILGQLSELFIPPSNYLVLPVVGYIDNKPDFFPDPKEVELVFDCDFEVLSHPSIISKEVLIMKGFEVNAPIYNFENQKIWGATAMIIAELLHILR